MQQWQQWQQMQLRAYGRGWLHTAGAVHTVCGVRLRYQTGVTGRQTRTAGRCCFPGAVASESAGACAVCCLRLRRPAYWLLCFPLHSSPATISWGPSWGTQSGSPVGEPSRGTQLAVGGSLICVAPQHAQSKRCLRTGGSMEAGLECLARGESIGRE